MRRRPLLAALVLAALVLAALALVVAGCGGSKTYTLEKTRACLEQTPGLLVRAKVDFVASTALGGAVNVRFRKNQATLAFGLDRDETERIVRAYQRFHGKNIGLADVLRPERNVVTLWAAHPSDANLTTIRDCLK